MQVTRKNVRTFDYEKSDWIHTVLNIKDGKRNTRMFSGEG